MGDKSSLIDTEAVLVQNGLVCGLMLFVLLSVSGGALAIAQTTEHPYIEADAIKSETCLTCHPDKEEGKFVHSAVALGCGSCHQATSEKKRTTITLLAAGGELCAVCHEASKDPVLHGPYKAGQCLTCHDPHTSNFPKQTRADVSILCMSCHSVNRPDVQIDREAKTVTILGNQTLAFDAYREAQKIRLGQSGSSGHPIVGHPITGKDPRRKDAMLNCLSCHAAHSSTRPGLLPPGVKGEAGLCVVCHRGERTDINDLR